MDFQGVNASFPKNSAVDDREARLMKICDSASQLKLKLIKQTSQVLIQGTNGVQSSVRYTSDTSVFFVDTDIEQSRVDHSMALIESFPRCALPYSACSVPGRLPPCATQSLPVHIVGRRPSTDRPQVKVQASSVESVLASEKGSGPGVVGGTQPLRYGVATEQGPRDAMEDVTQVVEKGRCDFLFASEFPESSASHQSV